MHSLGYSNTFYQDLYHQEIAMAHLSSSSSSPRLKKKPRGLEGLQKFSRSSLVWIKTKRQSDVRKAVMQRRWWDLCCLLKTKNLLRLQQEHL